MAGVKTPWTKQEQTVITGFIPPSPSLSLFAQMLLARATFVATSMRQTWKKIAKVSDLDKKIKENSKNH